MTREEAIQHFKEQLDIFGGEHAEAIKVAIEALQTDIVRCKDCKWYESGGLPCPLDLCESLGDDGFCSYGERSEE